MWRGRAGAEGPRRAAEGCRPSCARADGEATQLPWACLPKPPSHEGRGRGTKSLGCGGVSGFDSRCLCKIFQHERTAPLLASTLLGQELIDAHPKPRRGWSRS